MDPRYGVRPEVVTEEQRFWSHVAKDPRGCWYWTAYHDHGYGIFKLRTCNGNTMRAHRYSYIMANGPIPAGMQIDHLCRMPLCVNPAHLEAVTAREHVHRSESCAGRNARKTHCLRGHELTPDNTYSSIGKSGFPRRHCRMCSNIKNKHRYL